MRVKVKQNYPNNYGFKKDMVILVSPSSKGVNKDAINVCDFPEYFEVLPKIKPKKSVDWTAILEYSERFFNPMDKLWSLNPGDSVDLDQLLLRTIYDDSELPSIKCIYNFYYEKKV